MTKRPEWLDSAVFYEIYPQSFLDTDDDGIGNINGITRKPPKDYEARTVTVNEHCIELVKMLQAHYEKEKQRLGHSELETTQKYLHYLSEADVEAVNVLTNMLEPKKDKVIDITA